MKENRTLSSTGTGFLAGNNLHKLIGAVHFRKALMSKLATALIMLILFLLNVGLAPEDFQFVTFEFQPTNLLHLMFLMGGVSILQILFIDIFYKIILYYI